MYVHSILVTANYKGNEFLFRCMSIEKTKGGMWRAWFGDQNNYTLAVEFKKGVNMVEFLSTDAPSYDENSFEDETELKQIVKRMW